MKSGCNGNNQEKFKQFSFSCIPQRQKQNGTANELPHRIEKNEHIGCSNQKENAEIDVGRILKKLIINNRKENDGRQSKYPRKIPVQLDNEHVQQVIQEFQLGIYPSHLNLTKILQIGIAIIHADVIADRSDENQRQRRKEAQKKVIPEICLLMLDPDAESGKQHRHDACSPIN